MQEYEKLTELITTLRAQVLGQAIDKERTMKTINGIATLAAMIEGQRQGFESVSKAVKESLYGGNN